jgi:hypothetical protein
MSGILSTDGDSILSRYMAAMTAAIASTAASLPNNGSENERSTLLRLGSCCELNLNRTQIQRSNE